MSEVLDRLVGLGDRVVLVRGNADRELVTMARGEPLEPPDPIAAWAAEQLSERHVALLDALRHPVVLDVDGFGPVLFCHGTPRDDNEAEAVLSGSTYPQAKEWADYFVRSAASDAEALAVFGPRDGR